MATLKELLEKDLTKKELEDLITSYDVIGSREGAVAIIEIPDSLEEKKETIADAIMSNHKNVNTVLRELSDRKEEFRLRDYEIIKGEKDTEVLHKESGCKFLLDPQKVFFSPREGTERILIAEQIKDGEDVCVFFAGCGPYVVVISKNSNPGSVTGIEINPDAVDYMKKNIELNKIDNASAVLGDVKEVSEDFEDKFDRVVMPLGVHAHQFLDEAFLVLKDKGVINFYNTEAEETLFDESVGKVVSSAKRSGYEIKMYEGRKMSQYASRVWKVCLDLAVERVK